MKMITVGEHTIIDIPFDGGRILDVGCRSYSFTNQMLKRDCEIWTVEPDKDISIHSSDKVHVIHAAISSEINSGKDVNLVKWSYGEGNYIEQSYRYKPKSSTLQQTFAMSISDISKMVGVHHWDIVKLDCEGSEYEVLLDWPGLIADQITVEFHDFCGANPGGEEMYKKIFKHIRQWYDIVQHEKSIRGGGKVKNYWDSLFIRKGFGNG